MQVENSSHINSLNRGKMYLQCVCDDYKYLHFEQLIYKYIYIHSVLPKISNLFYSFNMLFMPHTCTFIFSNIKVSFIVLNLLKFVPVFNCVISSIHLKCNLIYSVQNMRRRTTSIRIEMSYLFAGFFLSCPILLFLTILSDLGYRGMYWTD